MARPNMGTRSAPLRKNFMLQMYNNRCANASRAFEESPVTIFFVD